MLWIFYIQIFCRTIHIYIFNLCQNLWRLHKGIWEVCFLKLNVKFKEILKFQDWKQKQKILPLRVFGKLCMNKGWRSSNAERGKWDFFWQKSRKAISHSVIGEEPPQCCICHWHNNNILQYPCTTFNKKNSENEYKMNITISYNTRTISYNTSVLLLTNNFQKINIKWI